MNVNDHLRRDIHLVNKAPAQLAEEPTVFVANSKTRVKRCLELRVKLTRHMNGSMLALEFIFAGRRKRCMFSYSILAIRRPDCAVLW